MGVPKLFKIILDNFPKSHSKVKGQPIDYFFVDFNSIIYEAWEKVKREYADVINGMSKAAIEKKIIDKVVEMNHNMIINVVNPKKMVYFAFDGPPPRGKMVQQRDRRYKKMYELSIINQIKEDHGVETNEEEPWTTTWITPGTDFMLNVSAAIEKAIVEENFPGHLEYVLSDTTVPGEGEHKFLKFLDKLESSRVCIYSNDGDVIMLVNRFPQHHVYILAKPNQTSRVVKKFYADEKYIYLVVDGLNQGFAGQFRRLDLKKIDLRRLKIDYIFFTMIGGNDFVQHIYFLKMKDEHSFKVMKGIYQALFPKYGHLIKDDGKFSINQKFLENYLLMLAKQELKWLKEKQNRFENPKKRGKQRMSPAEKAAYNAMPEWEKEWQEYQHTEYYKKEHPRYSEFKDEFRKIDYHQKPNRLWKKQYYQEFFGINYDNKKALNQVCFQYMKSWVYTLHYYLDEVPSWGWYYPYHASPLPSDLLNTVRRIKDINTVFKFQTGFPFKPLDQLMMVLPKKMAKEEKFLSPKFIEVMEKYPEYYPDHFEMDVLWGQKYIYSEPELPNIDAKKVLGESKKLKLTAEEKRLDKLNKYPLYFGLN